MKAASVYRNSVCSDTMLSDNMCVKSIKKIVAILVLQEQEGQGHFDFEMWQKGQSTKLNS